jgi:ABC-type transport system involved in multi-copper enzyme maturation permease subunit
MMKLPLWQVLGLIGVEFKLHSRRRSLVVLTLAMLVLPVGSALLFRSQLNDLTGGQASVALAAVAADQSTVALIYMTWAPVYIVFSLLLPPVLADSIPRDRQDGVSELLDSLPLTPGVYLLGKVLGAWLSALAALPVVAVVAGAVWVAAVGGFRPLPFLEMLLVGAGGVALGNGCLAVLLAAGQPTRRRAVLLGAALSVVTLFTLTLTLQAEPTSFLYQFGPARPALFSYYLSVYTAAGEAVFRTVATAADVWRAWLAALATLLAAGAVIWTWMQWRLRS